MSAEKGTSLSRVELSLPVENPLLFSMYILYILGLIIYSLFWF